MMCEFYILKEDFDKKLLGCLVFYLSVVLNTGLLQPDNLLLIRELFSLDTLISIIQPNSLNLCFKVFFLHRIIIFLILNVVLGKKYRKPLFSELLTYDIIFAFIALKISYFDPTSSFMFLYMLFFSTRNLNPYDIHHLIKVFLVKWPTPVVVVVWLFITLMLYLF